jgi:hypothetical protein
VSEERDLIVKTNLNKTLVLDQAVKVQTLTIYESPFHARLKNKEAPIYTDTKVINKFRLQ